MMRLFVVSFLCYHCANGFLLNQHKNSTGQAAITKQFLTVSDFLDAKKEQQNGMEELHHETEQLRHETEQLRHDIDNTLNILVSQIQGKLDSYERKTDKSFNKSQASQNILQELTTNHTQLKQDYENLEKDFINQQAELIRMKNKLAEWERSKNYSKLEESFGNLNVQFSKQQQELIAIRNISIGHTSDIHDLKQLKSIQALWNISAIQKDVQLIKTQTQNLNVNEHARTQDFLALYNITVDSRKTIQELERNQNLTTQHINKTLQKFELEQNATIQQEVYDIYKSVNETARHFFQKLQELEQSLNKSFSVLDQNIARNSEKVALTACMNNDFQTDQPVGHIIRFGDIRTNIGVKNLSSFDANGKFVCEKDGIYLVSVWAFSRTPLSEIGIFKDGKLIANAFITNDHSLNTGTAVVTTELRVGDTIWSEVRYQMTIHNWQGHENCMTILKVK